MRNLQNRAFRLGIAFMLAFLIASQIPMTGTVALAQNNYNDDGGDNNTGKTIAIVAGVAAVGYGVYYLVTKDRNKDQGTTTTTTTTP